MTAETSNARGEWVLVPREPTGAMIDAWRDAPDIWGDAYAAMLAAAPPPAGDAEVWLFKGTDGAWHTFHNEQHRLDTIADGRWDVRKFYDLAPPPAAARGDVRGLVAKLAAHVRPTCSELWDEAQAFLAAEGVQAVDGCHCGTCTCNPNMTPAVRFDLSPAQKEGAIREHLIRLGWTPPAADAEAKTVPVPTRVHLIGETAVIVGTPGRGWDEDSQDAHNCDAMGCATIGPHVLARVPFTDERALSQQPTAVDEAAAIRAFEEHFEASAEDPSLEGELELWLTAWRKALDSAPQQPVAVDVAAAKRAVAAVMSAPDGISVEAFFRIVLEAAVAGQRQEPTT